MQNPERVESIEMVLEDLGKMNILNRFKNLKTLILINQGLTEIEVYLFYMFKSIGPRRMFLPRITLAQRKLH